MTHPGKYFFLAIDALLDHTAHSSRGSPRRGSFKKYNVIVPQKSLHQFA